MDLGSRGMRTPPIAIALSLAAGSARGSRCRHRLAVQEVVECRRADDLLSPKTVELRHISTGTRSSERSGRAARAGLMQARNSMILIMLRPFRTADRFGRSPALALAEAAAHQIIFQRTFLNAPSTAPMVGTGP
mmetsp:Transcript_401/g.1016  ORF Transcript_401/g.1016 Transcript_401/m.1016 type:complete len:134 (-) Transcript_401:466-867(-)